MCSRRWRNRWWEGRQRKRQIRKSKKREGLNYARRATRGMRIVVEAEFIKGDNLEKSSCDEQQDHSSDSSYVQCCTQEKTLNRLSCQVGALMRLKKNVADTSKTMEKAIGKRRIEKMLEGSRSRGWLSIN